MYKRPQTAAVIRRTKLALRRETIAHLTTAQLRAIVGGQIETVTCPTGKDVCSGVSQIGPCDPRSLGCTGV
jgi:hypothetical protein